MSNWPSCECNYGSPIVLDVSGNGFNLTNPAQGVNFDLDGSGVAERLSWTSFGSDDSWLAWDRNVNGVIDDGTELFGNYTTQPDSQDRSGFTALAVYDKAEFGGNEDGRIDANDSIFASLKLWRDFNHNGVSGAGELTTLPQNGIVAVDLDYKKKNKEDEWGNKFVYRAKLWSVGNSAGRFAWDVFLRIG